jgi:hypothetical protein
MCGVAGIYGCNLVQNDIEMKSSDVQVDNSELLLFNFLVCIFITSWYANSGSDIAFNTSHAEDGIIAGTYIAFAIVAVLIATLYFAIHLSLQYEFLHVMLQGVASA